VKKSRSRDWKDDFFTRILDQMYFWKISTLLRKSAVRLFNRVAKKRAPQWPLARCGWFGEKPAGLLECAFSRGPVMCVPFSGSFAMWVRMGI
jgi:hypothetical protein